MTPSREAVARVRLEGGWDDSVPDEMIERMFITHWVDLAIQCGYLRDAVIAALRGIS